MEGIFLKKILLLGGSDQQIIAIEKAKELGYLTILCDYLHDNPGQYISDKFYQVSTTDIDAVLDVAQKEEIDGIVAYSSDPAAPTAAYVSEVLGLKGVPFSTAKSFCNKNLFRSFLKENHFNVPKSIELSVRSKPADVIHLALPIIIKPTDSSGSKGVTVLNDLKNFNNALLFAEKYSRNNIIIAEEYISRDHEDVIETEIFVVDGEVKIWGIMSSIRDKYTNPLIPAAYSYPVNLPKNRIELVKREVSRLVKCSRVLNGAFNIEMLINNKEELYFIDAGPRNGGNMLPEYISMIANADIPKATLLAAMNRTDELQGLYLDGTNGGYWGLYVIHSDREGILKEISYSEIARKSLLREHLFKKIGSTVRPFENSRDAIGLAFFRFKTGEERDMVLRDFKGEHIKISLQ